MKVSAIGMGVFDGLHLGHQEIFNRTQALLTFNPHPAVVLGKKKELKQLTTLTELKRYAPCTFTLQFNQRVAAWDPIYFLTRVVQQWLGAQKIVVGYDFRFGFQGAGTVSLLQEWASVHQIEVDVVPPKLVDGKPVKSSQIRDALLEGHLDEAVRQLGHPYLMEGLVVRGEGRGRQLGFPTANLAFPSEKLIPKEGVYCGFVCVKHNRYPTMVYIGNKPTFSGTKKQLEAHLFEFNDNLYDQHIFLHLTHFIRSEKKFEGPDALRAQLACDQAESLSKLNQYSNFEWVK